MATNNFKPGGNKFASGIKFKGRASSGDFQKKSSSEARSFNTDRPAREGAGNEGKKVFNRSERFTRNEAGKPRAFDRSTFKSKAKFDKPAPYKGSRNAADENQSQERTERPERSSYKAARESQERPRYGERKQAEGSYAARGERKPFGTRSFQKPSSGEGRREDKPESGKRFDKFRDNRPTEGRDSRSYAGSRDNRPTEDRGSRSYAGSRDNRPTEDRGSRSYAGSRDNRPTEDRGSRSYAGSRDNRPTEGRDSRNPAGGRDNKRSFRSQQEEAPKEAPNYDLKRFQGRQVEKKDNSGLIRLNRYIANAGICSRREADTLIASGEIKVNGEVVTEMGYTVRPEDTVTYGKKRLNREKMVYVLLNKPKDFITTTEDPEGRKTVMDLVGKASKERIFPVGRLDRNTTGLLLFTNDGELAHKLTHPSNNISKIYQVELDKPITRDHFQMIVNGLELEDGKADVDDLAIIGDNNTFLGIQIHIGKNRIVRRIFEHLGYEVVSLDRVQYAGLTKKDLSRGNWRFLNEKEVIRLKYFL